MREQPFGLSIPACAPPRRFECDRHLQCGPLREGDRRIDSCDSRLFGPNYFPMLCVQGEYPRAEQHPGGGSARGCRPPAPLAPKLVIAMGRTYDQMPRRLPARRVADRGMREITASLSVPAGCPEPYLYDRFTSGSDVAVGLGPTGLRPLLRD